jgi:hypothetical protein
VEQYTPIFFALLLKIFLCDQSYKSKYHIPYAFVFFAAHIHQRKQLWGGVSMGSLFDFLDVIHNFGTLATHHYSMDGQANHLRNQNQKRALWKQFKRGN